jgi:pimeloyl-ACP methyl ester carboxylesterase
MVEFVRADIAVHLFDKPVYLVGLSLGAMVALEWARLYPAECAGAVLMSTSVRGLSPFYQRLKPPAYWPLLRALASMGTAAGRESLLFDLTSSLNRERDATVGNWVRYASELPCSRLNALRQLLAALRYKLPADKPQVPLLLLRGMADRMVDPACSARLAQHWQLPLQSHPDAGHDLTLDDRDWVCRQINDWLETLQDEELANEIPGVV